MEITITIPNLIGFGFVAVIWSLVIYQKGKLKAWKEAKDMLDKPLL